MQYELFYGPRIPGRGEFVRLALEEAGADYLDVGGLPEDQGGGQENVRRLITDETLPRPPYAMPCLRAGNILLSQTANILLYLGGRLGLAPKAEEGRLWANQIQMTMADFVLEAHNTHHPISGRLYYEEQLDAAKQAAAVFLELRLPKFLGYTEAILTRNPGGDKHLVGARVSYPDLSLFQVIGGLRHAFPKTMAAVEGGYPRTMALAASVAERPKMAAYLASDRRRDFNEFGLFRNYPELDVPP